MPLVVSSEFCIPEEVAAVALPTATLSVIIPAFNEVRTVLEILQRVLRQSVVAEIVLVDDGSTDGTWEAVQQFAESADPSDRDRLVLLQHTKNRGKGRAIRTALEHVSGSHVLIQDADLEYDPKDINKLWAVMLSGEADVVFGSRYLENAELQKGRWLMQSGVRFLNLLVRMLYGIRLTDEATCYKLLRTADLKSMDLQCERFEFCPEVVAKISIQNLKVAESPIGYNARRQRDGKKLTAFDAVNAIRQLVICHPKMQWCANRKTRFVAKTVVCVFIAILFAGCMAQIFGTSETVLSHTSEKGRPGTTNETFDLGITTPGSTISRDIEIPNTTAIAWNIIGNTTTCG